MPQYCGESAADHLSRGIVMPLECNTAIPSAM